MGAFPVIRKGIHGNADTAYHEEPDHVAHRFPDLLQCGKDTGGDRGVPCPGQEQGCRIKVILLTDEKFNNIQEWENASGGPVKWSAGGIFPYKGPGQGRGQQLEYHGKFPVIPLILRQAVLQKVHHRSCSRPKAVL